MTDAITLCNVQKSFGALQVISGVDLVIQSEERHALIGPNGAGKSTLFNIISGRTEPSQGSISLFGAPIQGLAPHRIARRGLSRSFQITHLFPKLTVQETLEAALLWPGGTHYAFWRTMRSLPRVRSDAREMAELLSLDAVIDVRVSELPYADQRALEIGVAVCGDAKVVLLDEPTAGMSHAETERMTDLIRRVTQGRTLIMVEHDMGVVFDLADRISVLAGGRIIATGTPSEIRGNAAVKEAYLGEAEGEAE
ncbi:amino acid/amide ABC transporter ATP-binding protein 1, HAAT family [Pseudosulfitobacter pseudonitzschiae]|uniref:ABC transporter domain-containing protein n=1 Tax=Pseudosulfitobacter pseudonitzschiae TaxID=1402135 RepID=A0A073JAV6_9RHOB|nr:ABC transporter ATP-binding protein [Pseudosulfitobacter pseudonitzschiae]KEJ94867.1 hypothetical protein SUH3_24110 [Pseudosulfitobacter pseudonitzschiae]QKS07345.1 ABC transporter ATP-binding protein [Pseudosulfitobacter pseudonitzschiae]SHF95502.1 amino acid/amide ABC transporter ATP-binding protein 1, HAAT family [Pseudosulfitobacter pseudonitzschiae]